MGQLWLRWTVRWSLTGYVLRLARDLGLLKGASTSPGWQATWLVASLLLLIHALIAFAVVHGWSHAHAYDHTARRSAELAGVYWGGGLYLNEVTIGLWIADALWCCLAPTAYERRSLWIGGGLHLWILFMAINGAIVFESGPTRWVSAAVLTVVTVAGVVRAVGHPKRRRIQHSKMADETST